MTVWRGRSEPEALNSGVKGPRGNVAFTMSEQ
jgi:hypothetical protein